MVVPRIVDNPKVSDGEVVVLLVMRFLVAVGMMVVLEEGLMFHRFHRSDEG
jgi:hypothetical protein